MRVTLLLTVMTGVLLASGVANELAKIDFVGFEALVGEVGKEREARRVHVERFLEMAAEEGTVMLDTRSKAAYDRIHLKGAVHLNFSDFTAEKLAAVIPDKATRVLIYCNNNFDMPRGAKVFPGKSAPLALNVPTFINLWGYGYENLYELRDLLKLDDPRLTFEGTAAETK